MVELQVDSQAVKIDMVTNTAIKDRSAAIKTIKDMVEQEAIDNYNLEGSVQCCWGSKRMESFDYYCYCYYYC